MKIVEVASEHNHELLTDRDQIEAWLTKHRFDTGVIVDNGTIYTRLVDLTSHGLTKLSVQFGNYRGKPIDDCFINNNKLKSLKGSPSEVKSMFNCSNNDLTSLMYAPKIVGGDFLCRENNLTSLEHGPESVGSIYDCSSNKLTTLKGAPPKVKYFWCGDNPLESLEHIPKIITLSLDIRNIKIKSLEGIHKQLHQCPVIGLGGNTPINGPMLGLILISGLTKVNLAASTKVSSDLFKAVKIINKYLGQGRAGVLSAQDELQEHSLDNFAEL